MNLWIFTLWLGGCLASGWLAGFGWWRFWSPEAALREGQHQEQWHWDWLHTKDPGGAGWTDAFL